MPSGQVSNDSSTLSNSPTVAAPPPPEETSTAPKDMACDSAS